MRKWKSAVSRLAPTPPHHLENTYSRLIRAPLAQSVKRETPDLQVMGAFKLQVHGRMLRYHYKESIYDIQHMPSSSL